MVRLVEQTMFTRNAATPDHAAQASVFECGVNADPNGIGVLQGQHLSEHVLCLGVGKVAYDPLDT